MDKNCSIKKDEIKDEETAEESEKIEKNMYSTHKLRILGILWCDGDAKEKGVELYDVINQGFDCLTWGDKDFQPCFY